MEVLSEQRPMDLDQEMMEGEKEEEEEEDYEMERLKRIQANAKILQELGFASKPTLQPNMTLAERNAARAAAANAGKTGLSKEEAQRRKLARIKEAERRAQLPTRRSGRVAALQSKAEQEQELNKEEDYKTALVGNNIPRFNSLPKPRVPIIPSGPEYDDTQIYDAQPRPGRKADGTLVFEGRWEKVFTPNLTPEEMFRGGAFGGAFYCDTYSQTLKAPLSASTDIASLPFNLPPKLASTHLSRTEADAEVNRFKVRAGQSLQEWEKAGWIWHGDPRGWAQWYVRFWGGRRSEDDERQIRRSGPAGRFKRALLNKIHQSGGIPALEDEDIGRVLRQCLWQWGYELTKSEYERVFEGNG